MLKMRNNHHISQKYPLINILYIINKINITNIRLENEKGKI